VNITIFRWYDGMDDSVNFGFWNRDIDTAAINISSSLAVCNETGTVTAFIRLWMRRSSWLMCSLAGSVDSVTLWINSKPVAPVVLRVRSARIAKKPRMPLLIRFIDMQLNVESGGLPSDLIISPSAITVTPDNWRNRFGVTVTGTEQCRIAPSRSLTAITGTRNNVPGDLLLNIAVSPDTTDAKYREVRAAFRVLNRDIMWPNVTRIMPEVTTVVSRNSTVVVGTASIRLVVWLANEANKQSGPQQTRVRSSCSGTERVPFSGGPLPGC
jgi:hypothetical protein